MSNQISSKSNLRAVLAILFLMAGIGSSTRAADASLSQTPQQQMPGLTAKAGTAANIFNVMGASDTTYTVTQTGNYTITVRGADGGNGETPSGGGATVAATFALQVGDTLREVIGLAGANYGGGGGSAVILTRGPNSTLLLVAGAGGGGGAYFPAGVGGNAAQGNPGGGAGSVGGGGGGLGGNGTNGLGTTGGGAGTLAGGGASGGNSGGGYGFGGGGGGGAVGATEAGGGGGGYGGGAGGNSGFGGGGGSSFVDPSATNITRTDGARSVIGTPQNGSVSVLAPTAATVSVSGRVTTMSGRGIMNVHLTLTDSSGQTRTATTTSFGYYRFDDVQAGETYILSAVGKYYTFSQPPQVLNINEETNGVNFIANSERRIRVF